MRMLYVVALLSLPLIGCNDYPGQTTKEVAKVGEKINGSVKLTPKPNWDGSIGQDIALGGDCHIDVINDKLGEGPESHTIKQSTSALKVSGWAAVSVKEGVMASDIALALKSNATQGTRLFATPIRDKRQDVADYFKSPASIDTGFKTSIDISDVTPGDYTLEVIQHKDGKTFRCQYTAKIIIEK